MFRHDDSHLLQQFEIAAPATDQALIATRRKFARDAEALSRQFIAHGMPATFVADLTALVDGFESALRDRGLGLEARRAARLSTKAAVASGIAAVRRLDAVVTNHLAGDAVTKAAWERGTHRVPKRTNAQAAETPAPAAGAPEPPTGSKAA